MKYILPFILLITVSISVRADLVDGSRSRLDLSSAEIRISALSDEVYLPLTKETKRLLDVYTYSYLPGARRIVNRSKVYYPIYDYLLEQRGLPDVMKNIGIVESNLDPWTFSRRGAVGVWQLMKRTSRSHGLIIDGYVDERFDPVKSSVVAFDYLKELYAEFQDWNMTLVAYNFGPTALRKAIRYCGSSEYEIIKEALPRESVRYASRLAAASYLSEYHREHNILADWSQEDFHLASMAVYDYITFNEIARITGLSKQEIIEYNPAITYDYLPTNDKGYQINLPLNEMIVLAAAKDWQLTDLENFNFHKSQIESLMVFHDFHREQPLENSDPRKSGNEEDKLASDGLRREQSFRLIKLS